MSGGTQADSGQIYRNEDLTHGERREVGYRGEWHNDGNRMDNQNMSNSQNRGMDNNSDVQNQAPERTGGAAVNTNTTSTPNNNAAGTNQGNTSGNTQTPTPPAGQQANPGSANPQR